MTSLCKYLVSQPNGLTLRLLVLFTQSPLSEETFLFVPFYVDIAHFLSSDGGLLHDHVCGVPNDNTKHIAKHWNEKLKAYTQSTTNPNLSLRHHYCDTRRLLQNVQWLTNDVRLSFHFQQQESICGWCMYTTYFFFYLLTHVKIFTILTMAFIPADRFLYKNVQSSTLYPQGEQRVSIFVTYCVDNLKSYWLILLLWLPRFDVDCSRWFAIRDWKHINPQLKFSLEVKNR